MKAVLISIQPKWCELVASGEKTVEVRKTKPKIDVPFKVYIYETKDKAFENIGIFGWKRDGTPYKYIHSGGKVIGEFVCKRFVFLDAYYDTNGNRHLCNTAFMGNSCVTDDELFDYLYGKDGRKHGGWGWHISDLVIYDNPKELREFKPYNRTEDDCKFSNLGYAIPKCEDCHECYVKRPPQSWCYVEELKGE